MNNAHTNFPVSRDWQASWVWHNQAPQRNAWVLFRNDFVVAGASEITLYISADTRYRVWINGTMVGDGPPQSQPYHQYYDERNITPYLNVGNNCIAVLVQHQGVQDSARGGLLAEVVDVDGNAITGTGIDWRSRVPGTG